MNLTALIAVYFVVWWLVLFAVMPFGTRTQEEEGETLLGTVSSAPVKPMLLRKAIITSIVAAVVVGALWAAIDVWHVSVWSVADWFDLRR
jgi:predicted secreted protein